MRKRLNDAQDSRDLWIGGMAGIFFNVLLGNSTYSVSKFCILASTSVGKMAGNATIRACTQRQERHCARYVEQERIWPRLPPFLSRGRLSSGGSSLSVVQGGTRAY